MLRIRSKLRKSGAYWGHCVTLVEKDEQPPAAHRVILRAGRP